MIKEEFEKLLMREWVEEEREMIKRIMDGILYYKKFKNESFEYLYFFDNTCTRFIDKQIKEENYHNLLKKLPEKGISGKKLKI